MNDSPKGMSRFELEEALRQRGCAVCRLVERAGSSYVEYLLYDLVNDPDVHQEFRASLGLCGGHAQRMLEKGDGLGVAILYQAAVKELLGLLSKIPDAPRSQGSLAKLVGRPTRADPAIPEPGDGCMVCHAEREAEKRYLRVLLDGAQDGSLEEGLLGGPGSVCIRHLSRASALAGGWLPSTLIDASREALKDLEADLGLYVRHSDYRFRKEPWGKERDSWKRVVERMLGQRRA